jgi:hypothetical protein
MRMRFNAAERDIVKPGATVEWRNGAHWHRGIILGPIVRENGWDYAPMRNLDTTKTISPGDHYRATPTAVRARKA